MSSTHRVLLDYYEVLGVGRDATTDEIKKAFRRLARECHPDVAGDDPEASERFNRVRRAYEVLVDPVERARYDRRGQPRAPRWSARGFRMPGGFHFRTGREGPEGPARRGGRQPDLGLEDIFNDFGNAGDFGFGASPSPGRARTTVRAGRDIAIKVDVPARTALRGGVVTLRYPRMRRGEDGNLHRYDEIHDLRVPPGTRHGETIRVPRMGDMGTGGAHDGDLVCDVRVVPDPSGHREGRGPEDPRAEARRRADARRRAEAGRAEARRRAAEARAGRPEPVEAPRPQLRTVPISIGEAILGSRIEVDTPGGRVRLTVPAGSSSGTRLRLRGKGEGGADLLVELRIVVPRDLDEDGRELIASFMELYPYDPRGDGA